MRRRLEMNFSGATKSLISMGNLGLFDAKSWIQDSILANYVLDKKRGINRPSSGSKNKPG